MDLKTQYTITFLKAANLEASDENIKSSKLKWWWNIRSKTKGGLRLTEDGKTFIETTADIKTYLIEFPPEFEFTPQVLLWLDQFIESPFYITKKDITVLTETAAFELYLFSGDIRKFGHAKAMNRRLNQNSVS